MPERHESKAGDQQSSARNRKKYSSAWTTQRSSNFARILQNMNVLIAMPFQKSGSFIAVTGEIWSIRGVLQQHRRPIATSLQSLALSFRRIPVEDQKQGVSERQVMFYRTKQMLKHAKQKKHGSHPTILSRWYAQEKVPRFVGKARYRRKRSHAFRSHRSWKTRLYSSESWAVAERQTWILRLNADGPQKPLRQRPQFAAALKQCLKMQDAHLAEMQRSLRPIRPEHQQRQRQNQQFEGGENFDCTVDRKTGWRFHRGPRGNPPAASSSSSSTMQWPTSQRQTSWSSWQPASSEKWWWFRFPGKNSRKSTGGVDGTSTKLHTQRSTVCSQARSAHHALSSRPTWLQNCIVIFVRLKRVLSSGLFHVSSLVASLAFYHEHLIFLIHSSFHYTRTRSTIRYNMNKSENTQVKYEQDQICLYCRSRPIYESTIGRRGVKVSRRSHCCKRNKFTEPSQIGTQVYADASSV